MRDLAWWDNHAEKHDLGSARFLLACFRASGWTDLTNKDRAWELYEGIPALKDLESEAVLEELEEDADAILAEYPA